MSDYIITDNELYHYGVPGMRWGHRKAVRYEAKARTARESAKEWDEMSKRAASKGKTKKASKYASNATQDRRDARTMQSKLKVERKKNKFRENRGNAYKTRSKGAKLATNILGGPYANRTYNSVIAAGGTKNAARIVTGLTSVGGPLAHLAVSSLYTEAAGSGKTRKRY